MAHTVLLINICIILSNAKISLQISSQVTYCKLGENVTIELAGFGETWNIFHDNEKILVVRKRHFVINHLSNTSVARMSHDYSYVSIDINNVSLQDSGVYRSSELYTRMEISHVVLVVTDGPQFVKLNRTEANITVIEGFPIPPIECSADCNPSCKLQWNTTTSVFKSAILNLGTAEQSDDDIYECTATAGNPVPPALRTRSSSLVRINVQSANGKYDNETNGNIIDALAPGLSLTTSAWILVTVAILLVKKRKAVSRARDVEQDQQRNQHLALQTMPSNRDEPERNSAVYETLDGEQIEEQSSGVYNKMSYADEALGNSSHYEELDRHAVELKNEYAIVGPIAAEGMSEGSHFEEPDKYRVELKAEHNVVRTSDSSSINKEEDDTEEDT